MKHGDGIIVRASQVSQLEASLCAIESGPLDSQVAEAVNALWKTIEHEAPVRNYERAVTMISG
jgi:aflatoxin B1 aldehyde reductase